jgi:hypothetical protein
MYVFPYRTTPAYTKNTVAKKTEFIENYKQVSNLINKNYQFRENFVRRRYYRQDKHKIEKEHNCNGDGSDKNLWINAQLGRYLMILKVDSSPEHEHGS